MKAKHILTILAAGVTLAVAGISYAAGGATTDPTDPLASTGALRAGLLHRFAKLGVTDSQKQQIKQVLRSYLPQTRPLVKRWVTERRALRTLIQTAPVNEGAIRDQSAKVAAIESELAIKRAHIATEIRAVLTPDQISKLEEMRKNADARVDNALDRIAKKIGGE